MFRGARADFKELAGRPTADLLRPIVTPMPERSRRRQRGGRETPKSSRTEAWAEKDTSIGFDTWKSSTARSWNELGHPPALLAAQASSSSFRSTSNGRRWDRARRDGVSS